MNIVIMGPPGVGKGTQSHVIEATKGVVHISTGDILRMAIRSGSELGLKVHEVMNAGDLVSDDLIMEVIRERLSQDDLENGWLLDGFPRTAGQASAFITMLDGIGQSIDTVLVVRAPADEIIRRLNGRITCRACNEVMNLVGFGSSRPKFCPFCGSAEDAKRGKPALYQRADDTEETIRHRLEVFRKKTLPAAWLLEERYPLFEIDGLGIPEEVAGRIAEVLK
ncbi:MAG: adenylate kinase [Candidatus Krumholzibacteria bacterium]|nr:adenylate kinase [Candidatus Krumholzibacteria bacterium]